MKRLLGISLIFATSGAALAARSLDLREVELDGRVYEARPKGSVSYCPSFDIPFAVFVDIDRGDCLDGLLAQGVPATADVARCYTPAREQWLFDQLRLMGVTSACLTEKIGECARLEHSVFEDTLRQAGHQAVFTAADAWKACEELAR